MHPRTKLTHTHTFTHTHTPIPTTYLPCRVPNLSLDDLPIARLDALGRKFHANRTLALQVELVAGEPRQEVRLPHARIPNKDTCTRGGNEPKIENM